MLILRMRCEDFAIAGMQDHRVPAERVRPKRPACVWFIDIDETVASRAGHFGLPQQAALAVKADKITDNPVFDARPVV